MTLILGSLVWIALIAALFCAGAARQVGGALIVMVFGFLAYLFGHSGLSHISRVMEFGCRKPIFLICMRSSRPVAAACS